MDISVRKTSLSKTAKSSLNQNKEDNYKRVKMFVPLCSSNQNSIINTNLSKAEISLPLTIRDPQINITTPHLEQLKVAIRESGFSETGRTEILDALDVLAKYGIIATSQMSLTNGNKTNGDMTATLLKTSLDNEQDLKSELSNGNDMKSSNVEVPENIVGAILGTNGRKLTEIHLRSGAKIQISPKGIFAPGTSNRIVTITGHKTAIAKAKLLIMQCIQEEKSERAQKV